MPRRVDDLRVISGIIHVLKRGLQWRDAPREYGPHKTLYNRFIRWSRMGVFDKIFLNPCQTGRCSRAITDRRHPSKSPSHGGKPAKKRDVPRAIGRTKGGLNTKLHAVCDGLGRPVALLLSGGQMSDYEGARALLEHLPSCKHMLGDRGYDANWFRQGLKNKGIAPCIPPRKNRKAHIPYDKTLYKQRHKIKNMFGRIKDWRRIATRYDRLRTCVLISRSNRSYPLYGGFNGS